MEGLSPSRSPNSFHFPAVSQSLLAGSELLFFLGPFSFFLLHLGVVVSVFSPLRRATGCRLPLTDKTRPEGLQARLALSLLKP